MKLEEAKLPRHQSSRKLRESKHAPENLLLVALMEVEVQRGPTGQQNYPWCFVFPLATRFETLGKVSRPQNSCGFLSNPS